MLIKRELETIPVQNYPEILIEKKDRNNYVAATNITELKRSGKIVVIDVFMSSNQNLKLRFFSDGVNFLICKEWPAKEWSKRNLNDVLGYSGVTSTDEDREKAHSILKKGLSTWYYSYNIRSEIETFISEINSKKNRKATKRKYELMNEHFAMFPKYPEDLSEYCETNVFGFTYIFVSKIVKNKRKAICGHCGFNYEVEKKDKSGEKGVCPKCGMHGTYKGNWTGAAYKDEADICIASNIDQQLLLRWTRVTRTFYKNKYSYNFNDNYRNLYLNTLKGKIIYAYDYKSVMQWGEDWYRQNNGRVCREKSYVYTNNLREVFGETYYHVDLQNGMKNVSKLSFASLLDNLKNIPAAEYLFKMGLTTLASEITKEIVENKTGFSDALGVSKQYLPLYKKYNVNMLEHRIIQASKTWVNEKSFEKFRILQLKYYDYNDIEEILNTTSFEHFVNYFEKQKKHYKTESFNRLLTLYKDYVSMSQSLSVDMSRKSIRFPDDIKISHDLILTRFNKIKHQVEDENFKQATKKLYAGMKEYTKGDYCIVFPTSRSEFITEGQSLNHCVGNDSYYKNHITGTKMIFFIRKVSEKEKPYFTMEIDMRELRIHQLYGFGDCSAPPKVSKFASEFLKKLKPNYTKERKAS